MPTLTLFPRILIPLFAAALLAWPLAAQEAEARLLAWMDAIAQKQLAARSAEIARIRTPAEADRRKEAVRKKILDLIGGLPEYDGPLNPRNTGRIDKGRYVIEKVVYDSLPRFPITANVYRPSQPGRYPGILLPLGHWQEGKPAVQRIAGNLALKGFVVLVFDPVGQGERLQAYDARTGASLIGGATDQHIFNGGQTLLAGEAFARYRIFDAKRSLDYLVSRPDVDAERIGCTGCSGGGTLATYISALDPRIKVAAPACYMNSFRKLFSGPVGDSEQSIPNFLSSGLDQGDYVQLFSPKPWLIVNTLEDFFPIEGARMVYQEAFEWYGIYKAADKVKWAVGPGGHGTPREVREAIYEWMIRWLKDGGGDFREEPVELEATHALLATKSGQVATEYKARDLYEIILDGFRARRRPGTVAELRDYIRELAGTPAGAPAVKVLTDSLEAEYRVQEIAFESDPGLEIRARLLIPRREGKKKAVLMVETGSSLPARAREFAKAGHVVLALTPRGLPSTVDMRRLAGNWKLNTQALLIGRNLPAMRARDILTGVQILAARPDVEDIRATAAEAAGYWLLMAAAIEPRISRVWLDRTPPSLVQAMEDSVHRNLHDAIIPGFALRWDTEDLLKALDGREAIWSDPLNWMRNPVTPPGKFFYRAMDESDDRLTAAFLR